MGTYAESSFHEDTSVGRTPNKSVRLAMVAIFSALIAVGTGVLSIPLPAPLFQITLAPAIYLAYAALGDKWDAFAATGIGGFIGEFYSISTSGGGSPIYPFGMVWARAPEALMVAYAVGRGRKALVASMVLATLYETFAFLIPDYFFYKYALFGYSISSGYTALGLALTDLGTLVDLAFIPVALVLIAAAEPTFRRLGYRN